MADGSQALYFGVITMLASWAILVPSKLWEGRTGDMLFRRLTLASLGAGIGYIAWLLPHYMMIAEDTLFQGHNSHNVMMGRIQIADGSNFATPACFMIYFAALFALRRWWWQADSFRRSRFRVSSSLLTLLLGVVITGVLIDFALPESLGAVWALAISSVVQLSAGWTPPEERNAELLPKTNRKPAPEVLARNHGEQESPAYANS